MSTITSYSKNAPTTADYDRWFSDTTPSDRYHAGKNYTAAEAHEKSHVRFGFNYLDDSWGQDNLTNMFSAHHSELRGFEEPVIYEALYVWARQDFESDVNALAHAQNMSRPPHERDDPITLPTDVHMYLGLKAQMIARYWALHVDDPTVRRQVMQELGEYVARVLENVQDERA